MTRPALGDPYNKENIIMNRLHGKAIPVEPAA